MELVTPYKKLSGLSFWRFIPWGRLLQRDPLAAIEGLHKKFGDILYVNWPGRRVLFLWHPTEIQFVLKDKHTSFIKDLPYEQTKPLLGQGLFTSNDELWRSQRRIMAKQFHHEAIESYSAAMKHLIHTELNSLPPGVHDLDEVFSKLTLKIAGKIFFGADMEKSFEPISRGLALEMKEILHNLHSAFYFPIWVPTPRNIKRRLSLRKMDRVVEQIMNDAHNCQSPNVLSKLLKEEGGSRRQVRDEVMTLLLAGHETTSNQLMWTAWFMALHPEWQERLHEELKQTGKRAMELTREDFMGMPSLRAVLLEALRLRPPVPGIARTLIQDEIIGGYDVPKGTTVLMHPWITQRDGRFWPEPLVFNPERFFQRPPKKDDYSFFPFARGPRSCIGEELAMLEASLILAQMVERFEWKLEAGFEPQLVHQLTLRSATGMRMVLRERA